MKINFLHFLVPVVLSQSCIKSDFPGNPAVSGDSTSIDNMVVDPSFKFNTDNTVNIKITTLDNSDVTVPNVRINIHSDFPENGGGLIASCFTGSDGIYQGTIKLPAYADSLVLETSAVGFVQWQKRKITSSNLDFIFGGSHPVIYQRLGNKPGQGRPATVNGVLGVNPVTKALGAFNSLGVPGYLIPVNDVVDASLLSDINSALPEYKPVPTFHPKYLTADNQTNLVIQQMANVWVTFVHEGASYKNTLCYYKYNVNRPPVTAADIDTLYAVFPNTSYINSGGGLVSGNKVKIGTFKPGTGVGWALIANGYNGTTVTSGTAIHYSDAQLNAETNPALKKHCILLNDVNRGKFLLSFEDVNRENGSSDNDFNDAIFYVTADPMAAIDVSSIGLPAYTNPDTDRDGISDNFDDYPMDASMAFNNYYPSKGSVGTLAFEDLWPTKGDYDFNDMVLEYNFNTITNAKSEVVQINASITPKAIGASYHSGFGIQLPVDATLVASITGTDVRGTMIIKNSNGTEAGQLKATIIVFDDAFNQLPWPGTEIGVNTTIGQTYVQPKTLNLEIKFTQPVSAGKMGMAPFNPFIFTNKNRSTEIHLVNQEPTDLANKSLFGTKNDDSNPLLGRYYVTKNNLPFAIDIVGSFDYPVEKKVIVGAYLKFSSWGQSKGVQFKDWYKPLTGYRNVNHIFIR